ncbi:MAG: peptidyl-prolyl cis-trans isomerase [Methylacidiphilales bacterium]|nr:peptidyl-prolyl cis-trans isomerase [Candidatus Methylacidiphilales bacterium]
MMKFLRGQSQTVIVVFLLVSGVGFLFYGNAGNILTSAGARGGNDYGSIDGQKLSLAELSSAVRNTHNVSLLSGQNASNAQVAQEAWIHLLLMHEADRLHIQISDQEILNFIHKMSMFQKNGVYSPELFQNQMTELQNRYRISPDIFTSIISDNLRVDAASQALFSTVRASSKDIATEYAKYYGPVTVNYASFDPKSYMGMDPVTPDDIQAEYKAHPDNPAYRTPEKRKVDYVLFLLPPDQTKLSDKDKTAAINALGEKALDFALALQPDPSASSDNAPLADFVAEAKKRGLNPATTDFFAADTTPANVPPSPSFNNAAFALTKDNPVSKVVELDNGVALIHLVDVQPSELKPLDQVKDVITKQLTQQKAQRMAQVTAQIDSGFLKVPLSKGIDFKAAASGMKLTVQTVPPFVPMTVAQSSSPQSNPILPTLAEAVISLKPGEVSKPIPYQDTGGYVIAYLESRGTPDPANMADFEKRFRQTQDEQLRQVAFHDWLDWANKRPGTHQPPDLEAYGSTD